jgi:4-hydroxy-tetrahydrodipicolinate synthase
MCGRARLRAWRRRERGRCRRPQLRADPGRHTNPPKRRTLINRRKHGAAAVLRGVVAAIVTPFDPWDSVDLAAAGRLTGWLMDSGVHGIMTTGGTGEFPHLSRSERRGLTSAVVRQVGGRIPVIAGTGACSTREVLGLCEDAADVGADAVITVPPYYFPLPDAAIAAFFEAVADRSPLPVVVYNNPLYTGNSMRPSLIAEILCHDNIAGLKQSSSDLGQLVDVIQEVRVARGLTRALFTGVDSQFAGSLAIGADGIYSTAGGIIPELMVRLYSLAAAGETAAAAQLQLQPLNRFLEYDPGYVAPAKEALRILGLDVGQPRAPLPGLTDGELARLRSALAQLELDPIPAGKPAVAERG